MIGKQGIGGIGRRRLISRLHRSQHDFGPVKVPGKQGLVVGEQPGAGQVGEDVAEVAVGFTVVGPGGFDQAVKQGAGLGAPGRASKKLVLAAEHKGVDGIFRHVVVRRDHGFVEIDEQPVPLVEGIPDSLAEQSLRRGALGPAHFEQGLVALFFRAIG